MKVIIVADTHMPKKGKKFPVRLLEELNQADHIIHAGDFSTMNVYDELAIYAKITAVYGNIDDEQVRERLPAKQIITLNGFRIGIIHGDGTAKTTERRAIDTFANDPVDIIVYGHSHIPVLRYFKRKLLINPGSPTDKRINPYYSFVMLELEDELHVEHVFFK